MVPKEKNKFPQKIHVGKNENGWRPKTTLCAHSSMFMYSVFLLGGLTLKYRPILVVIFDFLPGGNSSVNIEYVNICIPSK